MKVFQITPIVRICNPCPPLTSNKYNIKTTSFYFYSLCFFYPSYQGNFIKLNHDVNAKFIAYKVIIAIKLLVTAIYNFDDGIIMYYDGINLYFIALPKDKSVT
jgi:hypothetical protein